MKRGLILSLGLSAAVFSSWGCGSNSDKKKAEDEDSDNKEASGIDNDDEETPKKPDKNKDKKDPSDNSSMPEQGQPKKPKKPKKEDGEVLYTYIWIANSSDGTISKINTRTMKEEGRYQTRPDRVGDPSRTSVGIAGDVVVANRSGGVTKVWADPKDCIDKNKDGKINTSTGADNVLKWGEDECIAWHNPMKFASQRVAAWTYEEGDNGPDGSKPKSIEKVWITGTNSDDPNIYIHLLDGETGKVLDTAKTPATNESGAFPYGAYGGAVDRNNNLWFTGVGGGKLYKVSYEDLSVEQWDKPVPSYGITVDPKGRPWICGQGTARFTPKKEKWDVVKYPLGVISNHGGCMVDGKGRLWYDLITKFKSTVSAIDIESLTVVKSIELPEHPHGISIDFDGNVWGVGQYSSNAYRVNPDTDEIDVFANLINAYTYSDMTGFALGAVQDDPPI